MKYTETEVREEAARHLTDWLDAGNAPSGDHDVAAAMYRSVDGFDWNELDADEWAQAREAIGARIAGAADLSGWAVNMGADGLEPSGHEVTIRGGDGAPVLRVHFGFEADLSEESRRQVTSAVAQHLANILL